METPVCDFIKKYACLDTVRFHVPGHKGREESYYSGDITEIEGADVLYHENGILADSQKNATELFGTTRTLFSTEGSSLCIRAMVTLVKLYAKAKGDTPVIAAGRNAHKVLMTAAAVLGVKIKWIMPENVTCAVSAEISPEYLRSFLENSKEKPTAVYITSPDYLGNMSDIKAIAEVCNEMGILLAIDNAHGAYLRFLENDEHPITLGAHLCCDSAHKTLPVLTGGAYLHISHNAPKSIITNAERAMSLFASTSPSYLTLASLDRFNGMWEDYSQRLRKTVLSLETLKKECEALGYRFVGNEKLKLTLDTKKYGYGGMEFADMLRTNGIECEFSDPDYVVMMFSPSNTDTDLSKLKVVLERIDKKESIITEIPKINTPVEVIPPEKALFMPTREISVRNAVGRILALPEVSCPPAVPIAVCGERLDENSVKCFEYYGIEKVHVVKEIK